MQLLEIYQKHPYEPVEPKASDPNQNVFKFNSPTHFISWVESLEANFKRGSTQNESDSNGVGFTQSKDLTDGFNKMRETKFESTDTAQLESKIAELKRGTVFADEGFELEIPEHLSGSDMVWIKPRHKRQVTRIIDDVLLIEATYNSSRDAETARKMGMAILSGIYRRRVIPRKIVLAFAGNGIRYNTDETHMVAIDVSFQDLNGIAKILHPSAFRRLWFRVAEIYPDLAYGYGVPPRFTTTKGSMSFEVVYDIFRATETAEKKDAFEKEIDTFLGIKR